MTMLEQTFYRPQERDTRTLRQLREAAQQESERNKRREQEEEWARGAASREREAKEKADAEAAAKAALQAKIDEGVRNALAKERREREEASAAFGSGGGGSGGSEPPKKPTLPVAPPPAPARSFSVHASLAKVPYSALRFGDRLGEGGFGVVHKGEWERIPVAIKELTLHSLSREAQESFERETKVMFGLRHPNITQLLAVCVEPGHFCLVMEYLSKGSLFTVLHDPTESLGLDIKYQIATQIAAALVLLHSREIVHRDLKSQNVLLDEAYNAKLSDFGLADIRTQTASIATKRVASTATKESIQGTVAWMAPEALKRGRPTNKVDVWAFGMIVWEMLSRKLPFADAASQAIVIHWIASGERETIPEGTPPGLEQLIKDCWEEDPARRPEATVLFKRLQALARVEAKVSAPSGPGPKTAMIMGMAAAVARVEDHVAGMEAIQIARVVAEANAACEPYEPG